MVYLPPQVAVGLSVLNLCVWGSWPYLRCKCILEGPSFTVLYFLGQFVSSLFLSMVLSPSLSEYSSSWQASPLESWRVLVIVLGGGCVGNCDFLCSLAMSRIHFSIAFPIYAGLALGVGSGLVYCVDRQGDVGKLFGGVVMALAAICSLSLAEAQPKAQASSSAISEIVPGSDYSPLHKAGHEEDSKGPMAGSEVDDLGLAKPEAHEYPPPKSQSTPPVVEAVAEPKESSRKWVLLCFFCGLVGGLWCPLSSLGRSPLGVTDPLVALVIFQAGQLSSVPLQCSYYALVLHIFESRPEQRKKHTLQRIRDPMTFLYSIAQASAYQRFLALATGALVGIGYTIFFLTSANINATVALAIPSCEPLVTIFMGVWTGTLRDASLATKILYMVSTGCFVAAVTLLALAV